MDKETNLTKEELATIESIDARLKELEGLVKGNGYTILAKEEQPKAEWTQGLKTDK